MADDKFLVSFVADGLDSVVTNLNKAGKQLDELAKKSTSASKANERFNKDYSKQTELNRKNLERLNETISQSAKFSERFKMAAEFMFEGIQIESAKTELSIKALTGNMGYLRTAMLQLAQDKSYLKHMEQLYLASSKMSLELEKLRKEQELQGTATARQIERTKVEIKGQNERAAATAKLKENIKNLRQEQTLYESKLGQILRSEKALFEETKKAEKAQRARAAATKNLKDQLDHLNTAEGRQAILLKEQISAKQKLIAEEARRNRVLEEARRELDYLRSAEGRQLQMIRQQIAEERRLGVERAKNTGILNQANAAFRATLTGLQASIGMYTSSTILIATAMYGVSRAFRSGIEQGAEFSASMARASAILNTSQEMMSVVEGKVRTMGRTTQYTSSEAAGALIELGMAGLSAGEAISALKPTLDLATIGNLSLSESAKLSTDILLMFNKEASELGQVVDVMAMAVTNSNATIAELTNSISYAGPAAATLGMGVEDVTASVEMLANAGIRGSRAGTALRRMFLNLAKPTAAGQAALDKYGISVTDLRGNTRDLTTVLELFANRLGNLSNDEKLKVLTEIFGVRAASGVNILVSRANEVRILREQLDLAGGAAEEMQDKIRDSLDFDFKEMKSTFQELQLTVFKDNEMTFRIWTQELKGFINYLSESTDGVTTRIESIAMAIGGVGKAIAIIVGANYGAKLLLSLGSSLSDLSRGMGTLRLATANALIGLTQFTTVSGTMAAASSFATRSVFTLSGALGVLRAAIHAIPVVGWLLGIGSAAIAIYDVVKTLYSDGTNRDIEKQNSLLKEQRDTYRELKDANKAFDLRAALESEQEAHEKSIALLEVEKNRLEQLKGVRESLRGSGTDTTFINKQIDVQVAQVEKLKTTIKGLADGVEEADRKLQTFTSEQDQRGAIKEQIEKWTRILESRQAALEKAESAFFSRGHKVMVAKMGVVQAKAALKSFVKDLEEVGKKTAEVSGEFGRAFDWDYDPMAEFQKKLAETREEVSKNLLEGKKTDFGTMLGIEMDIGELKSEATEYLKIVDDLKKQMNPNDLSNKDKEQLVESISRAEAALKRIIALEDDRAKATLKNYEHRKSLLKELLVQEDAEIKRKELLASVTGNATQESEMEARLLERKAELQERVNRLHKQRNYEEAAKQQGELNKVEAELDKILSARVSTYKSLYNAARPVVKAEEEFAEAQSRLTWLLDNTTLKYEDYLAAMDEAWKKKQAVIDANNKELQTLEGLRKAYGNTNIEKYMEGMRGIQSLRGTTYGNDDELNLYEERIRQQEFKSYDFKEPEVLSRNAIRSVGMPSSSMAILDVADGKKAFASLYEQIDQRHKDRMLESQRDFDEGMAKIEERKYLSETDRMAEIQRLREDYHDKMIAANDAKNEAMRASDERYAEFTRASNMLLLSESIGFASDMAGQLSQIAEEGSRTQKVAFGLSKALAAAQVIMNAHLAASKVPTEYPTMAAAPIQAMILAQGYSSAAMITAMAIKQYDKGGYIPKGQIGIVGEVGPEIVHGPANVTSRKETLDKLSQAAENKGGSSNIKIVNAFDTRAIGDYLNTSEGEKLLINTMRRNRQTIRNFVG
jgi:TP901 family phage tail tape measure protein